METSSFDSGTAIFQTKRRCRNASPASFAQYSSKNVEILHLVDAADQNGSNFPMLGKCNAYYCKFFPMLIHINLIAMVQDNFAARKAPRPYFM
jgi:hypothetical protein